MATNTKPTAKPAEQATPQQATTEQATPQQATTEQDAHLSPAEKLMRELEEKLEAVRRQLLAEKLASYNDRINNANELIRELVGAGFAVRLDGNKLVVDLPTLAKPATPAKPTSSAPKERKGRSWAKLYMALIAAGIEPKIVLPKTEEVVDLLPSGLVKYQNKEMTATKAAMAAANWPSANAWETCRLANVTDQPRCGDWYDDNVVS